MYYEWDSSLETGYEKIDNQHKQLLDALNKLLDASKENKGDQVVMSTLDFLADYVIKHFADEEKLQVEFNYADYPNHKKLHDNFRIKVEELVQRVKAEGPTQENIAEVSFAIGSWLVNHIKVDDFVMAAFIKMADIKS